MNQHLFLCAGYLWHPSAGEAFESTPFHRSLLADSSEEEYNLKPCICSSSPRGMDTVKGILTFITRLTELCLQSLHHRYVAWTKPEPTSLLLGTLTDQARSKSELVAENARLASTSDHPASPGETTCMYQEGPHAPGSAGQNSKYLETCAVHRPARDEARGGIVRASNSAGSTSPEQLLSSQGSLRRRWP